MGGIFVRAFPYWNYKGFHDVSDSPPTLPPRHPTSFDQNLEYTCGICLEIFNQPTTLPCGHHFCYHCIHEYWKGSTSSSCPFCRENFLEIPKLSLNQELLQEMRSSIQCDKCLKIDENNQGSHTCIHCLEHLCDNHLSEHHLHNSHFKHHQIITPAVGDLDRYVCDIHQIIKLRFNLRRNKFICTQCESPNVTETVGLNEGVKLKKRRLEDRGLDIDRELSQHQKYTKELIELPSLIEDVLEQGEEDLQKIETHYQKTLKKYFTKRFNKFTQTKVTMYDQLKYHSETTEQHLMFLKDVQVDHQEKSKIVDFFYILNLEIPPWDPTIPPHTKGDLLQEVKAVTHVSTQQGIYLPPPDALETRGELLRYLPRGGFYWNIPQANEFLQFSRGGSEVRNTGTRKWGGSRDRLKFFPQVRSKYLLSTVTYQEFKRHGPIKIGIISRDAPNTSHRDSVIGKNEFSYALNAYDGGYEFTHKDVFSTLVGVASTHLGILLDPILGRLKFYAIIKQECFLISSHLIRPRKNYIIGALIYQDSGLKILDDKVSKRNRVG